MSFSIFFRLLGSNNLHTKDDNLDEISDIYVCSEQTKQSFPLAFSYQKSCEKELLILILANTLVFHMTRSTNLPLSSFYALPVHRRNKKEWLKLAKEIKCIYLLESVHALCVMFNSLKVCAFERDIL